MPDAQMFALSKCGFDFVRLTLAPDVFVRAEGEGAGALYGLLRSHIARFVAHGLSVVVAFMPGDRIRGFTNADFVNDQRLFSDLCATVARCTAALSDVAPGRVVIEPLNEPALWGFAEQRWGAMQQRLYRAVRAASPTMPVVVTGARSGGLEGLLALDPAPYRGSDVFYSFHYYEPHIFTHQHVGESFKDLTGIDWPPKRAGLSAALERAEATITADPDLRAAGRGPALAKARSLLDRYYHGPEGPRTVQQDFARVATWANAHGIDPGRIMLGEFGVTRTLGAYAGASDADTAAWLGAVRTAAENQGFGWSMWAFSGPVSMTLANEYPARTFDPGVLRALGLRPAEPGASD